MFRIPTRHRPVLILLLLLAFPASGQNSEKVAVEIIVRGSTGKPATEAYVAVVPPWRALSDPSLEITLGRGSATLDLVPGPYTFRVSAPGHALLTRRVEIVDTTRLVMDLEATTVVEGIILDSNGETLSGARVTHAPLLGTSFMSAFSDRLRRELAGHSTTTRSDGRWILPLAPSLRQPLLVEYRLRAPHWVEVSGSRNPTEAITLQPGGALQVEVDRADPSLILTLRGSSGNTVPREWQELVWSKEITSTDLTWDSLAPGRYELLLVATRPFSFASPVLQLSELAITPDATTKLQLVLPAPLPADRVRSFFLPGLDRPTVRPFTGLAEYPKGFWNVVPHNLRDVSGGVVAHLASESVDSHMMLAGRYLAIHGQSSSPPEGEPVMTNVAEAAALRIALERAEGTVQPMPRVAEFLFSECRSFEEPIRIAASIDADGIASSHAPSGCDAISVAVPPFEAISFRRPLPAGTTTDLGHHLLRAGAVVTIPVRRANDAPVRARIELQRIDAERRSTVLLMSGETDSTGVIEFEGVPARTPIRLRATNLQNDLTIIRDLTLEPGERRLIDPVVLPEPASLLVRPRLSRELLLEYPRTSITHVQLSGQETIMRPITEGSARFDGLVPGEYRLTAIVDLGGSTQPMPLDPIEIDTGAAMTIEPLVRPRPFRGTVLRGEAPAAGRLEVGGHGLRRLVEVDEQGAFTVLLPRDDVYDVLFYPRESRNTPVDLGSVDFRDPSHPVKLHVPASQIRVTVRDSAGRPRGGIEVHASNRSFLDWKTAAHTVMSAATDRDGQARLAPLRYGTWLIQAFDPRSGESAESSVKLDGSEASVELTVQPAVTIRGRVMAEGRPVPATVSCFMLVLDQFVQRIEVVADRAGFFEIETGAHEPQAFRCAAVTQAGAIGVGSWRTGSQIEIDASPNRASLEVTGWNEQSGTHDYWLITAAGEAVGGRLLRQFVDTSGNLAVPSLPEGSWYLVAAPSDWRPIMRGPYSGPGIRLELEKGRRTIVRLRDQHARR